MKRIIFIMAIALVGCGKQSSEQGDQSLQRMADAVHKVLETDRAVYTQMVVNRLTIEDKVIKASEHWKEEKALVLPAQMFRASAERVNEQSPGFSYALISPWAINKKNMPATDAESKGMDKLKADASKSYYLDEELGGEKYFTAVYADIAVAEACVSCHNNHKDSPRKDFKKGDMMGAVVVRIKR
jgi:hypothetical protein